MTTFQVGMLPHVTRHAKDRYILRIKATGNATQDILKAWQKSQPATALDLERVRLAYDPGCTYRVGSAPNKVRFMMVAKFDHIVTILGFG